MTPRQRRLLADYDAVRAEYSGHPNVSVEPIGPLPPEAYRVTFRGIRGLRLDGRTPVAADVHVAEIRLPLSYPREGPTVVPQTPIFHPNVARYYCISDYWSAGQPLVDIIAKLADMIQYRIYNVRSPLDGRAARWAAEHSNLFPIGNVTLGTPEVDIAFKRRDDAAARPARPAPDGDDFPISLRR